MSENQNDAPETPISEEAPATGEGTAEQEAAPSSDSESGEQKAD